MLRVNQCAVAAVGERMCHNMELTIQFHFI